MLIVIWVFEFEIFFELYVLICDVIMCVGYIIVEWFDVWISDGLFV